MITATLFLGSFVSSVAATVAVEHLFACFGITYHILGRLDSLGNQIGSKRK